MRALSSWIHPFPKASSSQYCYIIRGDSTSEFVGDTKFQTITMNIMEIILSERDETQKVCAIWFHLYKVQVETKLMKVMRN